jgi:DNA-binding beta-propeller fold protein YncE
VKKFLSIIPFLLVFTLSLSSSAYPMGLDFGFGGTSGGPEPLAFEPVESFGSSTIPLRVAVDSRGRVLVTDSLRKGFAVYSNNGLLLKTAGGISRPLGIAVDSAGMIYVGDAATQSILVFDSDCNFSLAQAMDRSLSPAILPLPRPAMFTSRTAWEGK